jgi:hypothetical protein
MAGFRRDDRPDDLLDVTGFRQTIYWMGPARSRGLADEESWFGFRVSGISARERARVGQGRVG